MGKHLQLVTPCTRLRNLKTFLLLSLIFEFSSVVANSSPQSCDPSKCISPDYNGGYDCWALGGIDAYDDFECSGGYKAVLTGKKTKVSHEGEVYEFAEYKCCIAKGPSTTKSGTTSTGMPSTTKNSQTCK